MGKRKTPATEQTEPVLTDRRLLFVAEYIRLRGNGKQAAIKAGYSEKNAEAQASRLLAEPAVREAVDAALARAADQAEVDAAEVLRELKKIGFADPAQIIGADGKVLPLNKMPEDIRRCIASIDLQPVFRWDDKLEKEEHVGDELKIKFWPKVTALELLGKNRKLFTEVVDSNVTGSVTVVDPYAEPKGGK